MLVLNLGCGTKTSDDPRVVNIDWSVLVRLRARPFLRPLYGIVVSSGRISRLKAMPGNVRAVNLSKGIPFPDCSVDAVYHSHMLEHIDRSNALPFFEEVHRVLRPGGIHRTVVPDLEWLCRSYINSLDSCRNDVSQSTHHESVIGEIIEQMVRKIPHGTVEQSKLRRSAELALLGDARRRGETHQWMYDKLSLRGLYVEGGFVDVQVASYNVSSIDDWEVFRLELDSSDAEYKPHSLYVEGRKALSRSTKHRTSPTDT